MLKQSKILVVEDEALTGMELEKKLVQWGYDVVGIVSSGEDAVEKALELEPDLILMDYITQRLYEWGGGSQDHQKEPGNSYYLSDGLFQHGNFSGCQDHSTAGLSHQTL